MLDILKQINQVIESGKSLDLNELSLEISYVKEYLDNANIETKDELHLHLKNLENSYGRKLPYENVINLIFELINK